MRLALLVLFACAAIAAEPPPLKPVSFEEGQWQVGASVKQPQFRGVTSELWPPGLVPIFLVQKQGVFHLRRFPFKGQENISEPLFFGLPLEDEKTYLGGRWEVLATRRTERPFLYWELVQDLTKITGRFDRYTDYRFGTISGGEFISNRFEMKIEYIMDAFILTGTFAEGKLKGSWKRTDDAEEGTWEAKQNPALLPTQTNLVALFEWRKGPERAYAIEGKLPGADWKREERPLCRVWR